MKLTTCLIIIALPVVVTGQGGLVVVPNNLPFNEGNSSAWPFTSSDTGLMSRRYQQVYDASQFSAMGPAGAYIQDVYFREDMMLGGGGQIAHDFLDSVQISLGITARSPDSLSPSFAENIGPVYTTVFGPSPLEVSTLPGWAVIPLDQPFLYVPSMGNLLIDIRTIDNSPYPGARRTLDAQETFGDSVSAVMAFNDPNAVSGSLTTRGLVTGFTFVPIPEPSTWALLGLGLFGIWRFSGRRK